MFAKDDNGTLRILTENKIIGPKGQQSSRQILDLWTDAELKAWGIYEVVADSIPEGHSVVSETLVMESGVVRLARVTEVAPVIPRPNPVDVVDNYNLKIILSLQNQIRELKALPALKDVEELKVELKKTVSADVAAVKAEP